jgi:hypothetical protein
MSLLSAQSALKRSVPPLHLQTHLKVSPRYKEISELIGTRYAGYIYKIVLLLEKIRDESPGLYELIIKNLQGLKPI